MSLSELREKDVVNVDTGKKLGKVMDIEFCVCRPSLCLGSLKWAICSRVSAAAW